MYKLLLILVTEKKETYICTITKKLQQVRKAHQPLHKIYELQ